MRTVAKRILQVVIVIVVLIVLVVGGYVIYVMANYQRLGNVPLGVKGVSTSQSIQVNQEYQALSWNIGYGAYGQDYSFFMDESILRRDVAGVGTAGETIVGKHSTAKDRESTLESTTGVIETIEEITTEGDLAFVLLQEVDTDSHRSFRVNQVDMVTAAFIEENPQFVFANNFHSVWLQYPVLDPIGDIQSGLLTTSKFTVDSAQRYGYTIDESFPTKLFDLDRCFSASFIDVEGSEAKLVVINSHMTAFSSSNDIRTQQLNELMAFAQNEYDKGNYVIIGGDFNQAFSSDPEQGLTHWQNAEEVPTWVGMLDASLLGSDFKPIYAQNEFEVPTCRDVSFPYLPGENFEVVIDGFIVSSNVSASSVNIQEQFVCSDHNPVLLDFVLLQS